MAHAYSHSQILHTLGVHVINIVALSMQKGLYMLASSTAQEGSDNASAE